jgi:hypothetical protein
VAGSFLYVIQCRRRISEKDKEKEKEKEKDREKDREKRLFLVQTHEDGTEGEQLWSCCWGGLVGVDRDGAIEPVIFFGGSTGIVRVISYSTTEQLMLLRGHGGAVQDIAAHPTDMDLVITASKDESVRLWNWRLGVALCIFAGHQGHRDDVLSVFVERKGGLMVTGGMDNTVKLWALDGPEVQSAIEGGAAALRGIFAKGGAAKRPGNLNPVGPATPPEHKSKLLQFPVKTVMRMHFGYVDWVTMYGSLFVSKSVHSEVLLWEPAERVNSEGQCSSAIISQYEYQDGDIWFVRGDVHWKRGLMAVPNSEGVVTVFELDHVDPAPKCKLSLPNKVLIRKVCFSPCGSILIVATDDGCVYRFDLEGGVKRARVDED